MQKAFSLVELSIVLVILGLLTGGILAGQSLIRAAELRSVTTQLEQYRSAVKNFSDKYNALPGDISTATEIWGAAHATPATCRTTPSTTQATCNGDGNGEIVDNGLTSNEAFRLWQHLANAGLIEGNYNGITMGATAWSTTAANSPTGKITNSLWFNWAWRTLSGEVGLYDGIYNHSLVIGSPVANTWPGNPIFTPEELWNIDTKIDDGRPAKGTLAAVSSVLCTTSSVSSNLEADYLLTSKAIGCAAVFRNLY